MACHRSVRANGKSSKPSWLAGIVCASCRLAGARASVINSRAVLREGVTLVVSPLIALMKDQVDSLQAEGIRATFINSSLSVAEQRERLAGMAGGDFDLVYIAPERLRNPRFLEAAQGLRVQLLAVDEAHCISEWGTRLSAGLRETGRFRERLGDPQTIALTATATPDVREDIVRQLQLRSPDVFITGFARPNLRFEVLTAGGYEREERTAVGIARDQTRLGHHLLLDAQEV